MKLRLYTGWVSPEGVTLTKTTLLEITTKRYFNSVEIMARKWNNPGIEMIIVFLSGYN
jgi:hypothetical protein